MARYAISDIHGCLSTFRNLLDRIGLNQTDDLYLLGDMIDRGDHSKGVLDLILELQVAGYRVHCLRGNHEQMLLDTREVDFDERAYWMNGGIETLESFGVEKVRDIPAEYIELLQSWAYYFALDDYFLVHAGLDFNAGDPLSNQWAMLWIRNWYDDLDRSWLGEKKLIHGHTPMRKENILDQYHRGFPVLDIDAGCVHQGRRFEIAHLCALNLDTWELTFVRNRECKSGA